MTGSSSGPSPEPTDAEVAAGARALANLEGSTYFDTGNIDGIDDYLECAQAVLRGALPLIEQRMRGTTT